MKTTCISFLLFICVTTMNAQNTIAKFKYEDAEKAFNNGNYQSCLENLDEAEKLLGKSAPNILYLRIVSENKLLQPNPLESYEKLAQLREHCDFYLKNYDIQGLENKYRDVYEINNSLPQNKEAFIALKKEQEAQQLKELEKSKIARDKIEKLMPMILVKVDPSQAKNHSNTEVPSDYYIGKYEVTQKLWEFIMGYNPSKYKCSNCPVTNVSWYEVSQSFVKKLNDITKNNYSLPTKAQWEYAAKGGTQSKNFKYSGSNKPKKVAWYTSQVTYSDGKTHPFEVGLKEPNELGIHDMSGNVWEWCQDWQEPKSKTKKINKGGSYKDRNLYCQINWTSGDNPKKGFSNLGFRLVLMK